MLKASKRFEVRFSEVDAMRVAWHGRYAVYFEDAREEFGRRHGLGYELFLAEKVYAPIVELNIKYKRPMRFGQKAEVVATYIPTEAAKLVFDYEIRSVDDPAEVYATGHTVQVFMDLDYKLLWYSPRFYDEWKSSHNIP